MIDTAELDGTALPLETPIPPETLPADAQDSWMVIGPHHGLLDLKLVELWRYRDLILLFVWRDFVALYKQTILGPLWYVIQPVLTAITFTVVFGHMANLPTDGLPKFLFYMGGTVIWSYYAACLTGTANTFIQNSAIFGKVYFPRLVMPIAQLISKLISFGIQLGIFLAFMACFAVGGAPIHPNLWLLCTPLLLLLLAGHGLGAGIIVSALTTRYRDLQQLVAFGVQLLMYATPVIYSLSSVPARYRGILELNPLSPVIEAFRYAFLGAGTLSVGWLAYSFGVMLVILAVGLILFTRVERTFMDTV